MDQVPDIDEKDIDHTAALEDRRRAERMSVEQGGGGEAEGFEVSEQELVDHASHGDEHNPFRIIRDAEKVEEEPTDTAYGEADEERKPD
jgi:hypothetical protein